MFGKKDKPVPRNGHTLVVGVVARISGCGKQKEVSNEDQIDHARELIEMIYDGPVDFRILAATKAKGERLDRPELEVIENALRTREYDFLVSEDIGRILRGFDAVRLCGVAKDCGTRVLAPNDGIDTDEETWETDVGNACADHVSHNAHTSKRIKFKMMNRFARYGAAARRPIFGYIVPEGAKTYDDWRLDPDASAILDGWFEILETTRNASAVADWLNTMGIKPREWSKKKGNKEYDCRMVLRISRNPLLKGMPGRGFKATVKHNETGRRVSRKNPNGPIYREYPHLAHIAPERFDRVNALIDAANRGKGRKPDDPNHPLQGRAKKRTTFPGQHILCGVCGDILYWGGHGDSKCLMCSRARDYRCWNGGTINGAVAAERILGATLAAIEAVPEFDEEFLKRVRAKAEAKSSAFSAELKSASAELEKCNSEQRNLLEAIKYDGLDAILAEEVKSVSARKLDLVAKVSRLRKAMATELVLPPLEELKAKARTLLGEISWRVPTFNATMKILLPNLTVYPYRLCDGGKIVFRAKSTVDLGAVMNQAVDDDGLRNILSTEICVDLYDPPQRVVHREQIMTLRHEGRTEKEIAKDLGLTVTATQRAAALDRLMKELGITDPYVPLTEPPAGDSKFKRHLHPRYRFEPRDAGPVK